jgi:mono/diheme cytochrome c family protein
MSRNLILFGIALLAPALYAAEAPSQTRGVSELKTFYQAKCASCHGEDGSARAANGGKLKGFDFTDVKAMQGETDEALAKTIRKGIFFGLGMPSFKQALSDAEINLLVKEVLRKAEKGRRISSGKP